MNSARLEAFTDGVIAIIITIMVLEIHVPKGHDLAALREEVPLFLAYVLSYINVGIFWNNHHHMLQVTERVDGRVLWANLGLLFWLSLVPFVIRWIDEAGFTTAPVARLRRRAGRRRDCVPDPRAHHHCRERTGVEPGGRGGLRFQGPHVADALRARGGPGLCRAVDFHRALCRGRIDVAGTRPPHRVAGEALRHA